MDFGVHGYDDNNFSSSSSSLLSVFPSTRNGKFGSENGGELKIMFGSENAKLGSAGPNIPKRSAIFNDDDENVLLKGFKCAKTKTPLYQKCSQMLSFSSPREPLPLFDRTSSGYGYGGMNPRSVVSGLKGPFTPSQWMELEHQALIYKYITANVPIPSHLLNPVVTKAFHSSCLRPNTLGWGGFHLGFSNTDPEPGRCRRTDGKKWRCSRDAVVDQKYCERHLNRGRNRSRKPVEPLSATTTTTNAKLPPVASSVSPSMTLSNNHNLSNTNKVSISQQPASANHLSGVPNSNRSLLEKEIPKDNQYSSVSKQQNPYEESSDQEFGLVCSDSLLNPLDRCSSLVNNFSGSSYGTTSDSHSKSQHALRQFMDNWPKNQSAARHNNPTTISWPDMDVQQQDRTQLSISIPTYDKHGGASLSREIEATQMGLGVGPISSWEPSMGGPLGEVLHKNGGGKALNLMENWNSSSSSSPRGGESSKILVGDPMDKWDSSHHGVSLCSGAFMHPSLPAL